MIHVSDLLNKSFTMTRATNMTQAELWYRLVTDDMRPPTTTAIIDKVSQGETSQGESAVVLLRLIEVPLETVNVGLYWCDNRYYVMWSEISKLTKGKIPDTRVERICLIRTMWIQLAGGAYARRILVMWRQLGNIREEMARVDYKCHRQEAEKEIKLAEGRQFAAREAELEDNSCDDSDNEYAIDGFVVSDDVSDSDIDVDDEPPAKHPRIIED